ncbi:MAG: DUF4168 domain-containing protein [Spirochaetaceae bacterium]
MRKIRRTIVILVLLTLTAGGAFAQFAPEGEAPQGNPPQPGLAPSPEPVEVTLEDGELEQFARALIEVQIIQQDAQVAIQEVLDESDFDMMRFQEIHQSMMMEQGLPENVDESEEEEYETVLNEIQDVEMDAAADMEDAVVDQDLAVERFNEIAAAVPQDNELAEELNTLAAGIIEEDYADEF